MTTTKHVPLGDISIDGGTQARAAIHPATVTEYAEAMSDGETLPPAVVFFDGAQHHLADGFHRLHANRQIGATTMECEVRTGTLQDARLYAYGANKDHGLRRTADDKRKAVQGMLADFPDRSDRAIAKHVGVAHTMVAAVRSPEAAAKQGASRVASAARKVESDSTRAKSKDAQADGEGVESDTTPAASPTQAQAPKVESDSTPDADPRDEHIKDLSDELSELKQTAKELLADNVSMSSVFEADDKLAAALAENKRLRASVAALRERVNSLIGEGTAHVRQIKSLMAKLKKAGLE